MKRVRTRGIAIPVAGVLLAGLFSLGAAPASSASEIGAQKLPTKCWKELTDWGGFASCSKSNGGSFRATVKCKSATTGKIATYYGPWRTVGGSYAYCQFDSFPRSASLQKRS